MWTLVIIALAFGAGVLVGKFGIKDVSGWMMGVPALVVGYWEQITGLFG